MTEPTLLALEWTITSVLLFGGLCVARWRSSVNEDSGRVFTRIAANRGLAILIAGSIPVIVRLALLPVFPIPNPVELEEFDSWLQADTFASGRLTNPPHPMAEHIETFQELMTPTYASFRPPGPGMFMALGQVLFGHPWAGVCLAVFAFCAATCWMLQGWVPPSWALSGALFGGFWLATFGFWMNSYWGGAPAALGGCLVLGAVPRIKGSQSLVSAALLCLGIAILTTTRSYEGMFVILPVLGSLALWLIREHSIPRRQKLYRVLLPITLGVAMIVGWNLYYNWRVVGNPFTAPYQVGRARYNMGAPFVFQKSDPTIRYRNDEMRRFYNWELDVFNRVRTLPGYLVMAFYKVWEFWRMYIRPEFTLPLILIPLLLRRTSLRLPMAILFTAIFGLAVETFSPPYYYAPISGALILVMIEALRLTASWRIAGKPVGQMISYATGFSCMATTLIAITLLVLKIPVSDQLHYNWIGRSKVQDDRAAVARTLESMPGKHLVFVRYLPGHNEHVEWVWNRADIDASRVVWSRTMGNPKDLEMIRYFSGRKIWLVEPEMHPIQLIPISPDSGLPEDTVLPVAASLIPAN